MEATKREDPMVIRDEENNRVYTLDFTRGTVRFAEARGFEWDLIEHQPATMIPIIWYTAFRRYDERISFEKTEKLLERLGGFKPKYAKKLRKLYEQCLETLIATDEDDDEKNGLKVEL